MHLIFLVSWSKDWGSPYEGGYISNEEMEELHPNYHILNHPDLVALRVKYQEVERELERSHSENRDEERYQRDGSLFHKKAFDVESAKRRLLSARVSIPRLERALMDAQNSLDESRVWFEGNPS